jgi:hypothetical protein
LQFCLFRDTSRRRKTQDLRRKFGLNVWVKRFLTNPPKLRNQKFQQKELRKNQIGGLVRTRRKRLRVVGRFTAVTGSTAQ